MVSAVLAIILVTLGQKLFMKILGVNVMFFSWKTKIAWYIVVWCILMSVLGI